MNEAAAWLVVDELLYSSYRTQRLLDTKRDPKTLSLLYGERAATAMEERFCEEMGISLILAAEMPEEKVC